MTKEKIRRSLAETGNGLLSGARSLGNMTADAARKGKKFALGVASGVRTRVQIYREENKLRKSETELGRLFYDSYVSGSLPDSEKKVSLFAEIGENKSSIAALRAKLPRHQAGSDAGDEVVPDDLTDDDLIILEEEK